MYLRGQGKGVSGGGGRERCVSEGPVKGVGGGGGERKVCI